MSAPLVLTDAMRLCAADLAARRRVAPRRQRCAYCKGALVGRKKHTAKRRFCCDQHQRRWYIERCQDRQAAKRRGVRKMTAAARLRAQQAPPRDVIPMVRIVVGYPCLGGCGRTVRGERCRSCAQRLHRWRHQVARRAA